MISFKEATPADAGVLADLNRHVQGLHDVDEVQATIWAFNEQARAFFHALGFQVQVLRVARTLDQ